MKTHKARLETKQHEQDDDPRPFRLRLLQRLAEAEVDIAALWKILDGRPEWSRLAALLNSMCFTAPDDQERRGYPQEDVADARRIAAATVESSFRDIVVLWERHRPVKQKPAESPPSPTTALGGAGEPTQGIVKRETANTASTIGEQDAAPSYRETT